MPQKIRQYEDKKENCLFSDKDMYLSMLRSKNGRDKIIDSLPNAEKSECVYNNRHIVSKMLFDGEYPIIKPYNGPFNFETIAFTERNRATGKNQAVHFFLYDRYFRKLMWEKLEKTVIELSKFEVVFAPDFSLWVNLPYFYNMESLFKNRVATAYMQQCGINTIPVASFGNVDSLNYCFNGLPQKSIIGLCGVGHLSSKACDALWHYALSVLETKLQPTLIIIYGPKVQITNLKTPIIFITDFITKKFRSNVTK